MTAVAIDLLSRGWATWNLEYHRVGSGGGWPLTFEDVAAGLDHLAELAPDNSLDLSRVVAIGHSAGGHLALWAAARPHLSDNVPDLEPRVLLSAAIGLAPISNLESAFDNAIGDEAAAEFLRRSPADGPERYRAASPQRLLPMGIRQVIVHGTEDAAVPVAMSRSYAAAARTAGDEVAYHELDGVDHMSLIDPTHPAWQTVVAELDKLAG
jgi:acetyl esterase/lipase